MIRQIPVPGLASGKPSIPTTTTILTQLEEQKVGFLAPPVKEGDPRQESGAGGCSAPWPDAAACSGCGLASQEHFWALR